MLFELFVVLERLNKEHESGQGFARRFQLGGLAILFFWFFLLWLPLLLLLVDLHVVGVGVNLEIILVVRE